MRGRMPRTGTNDGEKEENRVVPEMDAARQEGQFRTGTGRRTKKKKKKRILRDEHRTPLLSNLRNVRVTCLSFFVSVGHHSSPHTD